MSKKDRHKKWTRRKLLLSAGGAALGGLGYVRFLEPGWLDASVTKVAMSGQGLSKPIRILHLSDFHVSRVVPLALVKEAIEIGLGFQPDLVCLTGDFFTHRLTGVAKYRAQLEQLSQVAPTFACPGNHDGGAWVQKRGGYSDLQQIKDLLAESGIRMLHNEGAFISVRGQKLGLVGVGDLWANDLDPERAFAGMQGQAVPVILLSHNPDSKQQLVPFHWDLMLCGHTHGGQLELPILGTPFAPVRDQAFVRGLHRWKERWIYITKGVGNLYGLRFNCRPEVSVLDLG